MIGTGVALIAVAISRRRFHFSLQTLFVAITIVACGAGLFRENQFLAVLLVAFLATSLLPVVAIRIAATILEVLEGQRSSEPDSTYSHLSSKPEDVENTAS